MQSKAKTVREYLDSLPADRRAVIEVVRTVILQNLDRDYEEGMQYGGIGYYVKRSVFPQGYHCDTSQPLPFAGLGAQKNHLSVGFMCTYMQPSEDQWLRSAWLRAGKKLDMGKCCIRFKKLDDVPLEVIGEAVRRTPAKKYIAIYLANLEARHAGKPKAKPAAKKPAKPAAKKRVAKKTSTPARKKRSSRKKTKATT